MRHLRPMAGPLRALCGQAAQRPLPDGLHHALGPVGGRPQVAAADACCEADRASRDPAQFPDSWKGIGGIRGYSSSRMAAKVTALRSLGVSDS